MDEGCSCHIRPPCGFCLANVECHKCGNMLHEDVAEDIDGEFYHEYCATEVEPHKPALFGGSRNDPDGDRDD